MTMAIVTFAALLAWIHADRIALALGVVAGGAVALSLGLVTVVFRIGGEA